MSRVSPVFTWPPSLAGFSPKAGSYGSNVFFSFEAANPRGTDQMRGSLAAGSVSLGWDSVVYAGDYNFQHLVVTAQGFDLSGQTVGTPMLAAEAGTQNSSANPPSEESLASIVMQARQNWIASGQINAAQVSALGRVDIRFADLDGLMIGEALAGTILLDTDAAGNGWFVDSTPGQNEEFGASGQGLLAKPGSGAAGRIDLLTVVEHEMGHLLGLGHTVEVGQVMDASLATGVRLALDDHPATPAVAQTATPAGDGADQLDWTEFTTALPQPGLAPALNGTVPGMPASPMAGQQPGLEGTRTSIVADIPDDLASQSPASPAQIRIFDERYGYFVPSKAAHKPKPADEFAVYLDLGQSGTRQSLYDLYTEESTPVVDGLPVANQHTQGKPAKPVRVNWAGYRG